jgi:hypothetical protein
VIACGAAGYLIAGPPPDSAEITPPPCPATYPGGAGRVGTIVAAPGTERATNPGATDRLVPVLPLPIGPVSVRLCAYRSPAAGTVSSSRVLDVPTSAALAALLDIPRPADNPPFGTVGTIGGPTLDASRATSCRPGPAPAVLMFRYHAADPLLVTVDGGACGVVATRARVEQDRQDVVRRVADLLATSGKASSVRPGRAWPSARRAR